MGDRRQRPSALPLPPNAPRLLSFWGKHKMLQPNESALPVHSVKIQFVTLKRLALKRNK
jgi:hypothetical protein